jgi:hypothetical protein
MKVVDSDGRLVDVELRSEDELRAAQFEAALTGDGLHDVIVWEFGTRRVCGIFGKRMTLAQAERRLETAYGRINLVGFTADIVAHGAYKEGDTYERPATR